MSRKPKTSVDVPKRLPPKPKRVRNSISMELVRRGVEEGKTDREMAAEMGVHWASVHAFRKRHRLLKRQAYQVYEIDPATVRAMAGAGKLDHEIAAAFGCSAGAVFELRRRNNIPSPAGRLFTDAEVVKAFGLPPWVSESQRLMLLFMLTRHAAGLAVTETQIAEAVGTVSEPRVKRGDKQVGALRELIKEGLVKRAGRVNEGGGRRWVFRITAKAIVMLTKGGKGHEEKGAKADSTTPEIAHSGTGCGECGAADRHAHVGGQ
jgi:hypothetical protein